MKNVKADIVERSITYSLRIIRLYRELEKDSVGRVLGKQLLRSGTSIGANVHEAQGAQSKADFIAKMSIAHKEAYECVLDTSRPRSGADLCPSIARSIR